MKPRRGGLRCCGMGCVGSLIGGMILFAIAWSWSGRYRPVIPPPKPLSAPNAFDDYLAAAALAKPTGGSELMYNGPAQTVTLAGEKAMVRANAATYARLRLGLTRQCRVRFDRDPMAANSYRAEMRELARMLVGDADVRAASGDIEGAVNDGIDCIHLGQDAARGGALIDALVGDAVEAIGQRSLLTHLERLSEAECERCAKRLTAVLLTRQPFAEVVQEERNSSFWGMEHMGYMYDRQMGQSMTEQIWNRLGWHFMRDQTMQEMDRAFKHIEAQLDTPFAQRKAFGPPRSIIGQIIIPTYLRFINDDVARARSRMLLAAVAIRGYRLRRGALPPSLAAAGVDPLLRRDPFSTGELVYRPRGGDYLLYSVGPDGIDDGGKPGDESLQDKVRGDIGIQWFRVFQRNPGVTPPVAKPVPHMLPPEGSK